MIGLNFAVSTAFVLVQTSAFGLFIEAFGSHTLPYAYFSVAILSSLIAYLYLQVSQRVSFRTSLYINLAFLAGVSLVFWLGLRSAAARWFIFLLPFWFQTLVNLANLVVWHLSGHMFHVRQAKRVFGLIVGGNWIANIVGGVLVASFLGNSSPSDLYLLAAIALLLSMLVLRAALANYRAPAVPVAARRPSKTQGALRRPGRVGAPLQPADLRLHAALVAGLLFLRTYSSTRWKVSSNQAPPWRGSWPGSWLSWGLLPSLPRWS